VNTGWRSLPFDDAIKDVSAGNAKLQTGEYLPVGRYPIVDQGKDLIAGYSDNASVLANSPGPIIIFGDHTRIIKYVDFPFCIGADGVKVLKPVGELEPKYAFHFLSNIELPSDGYSRHFKYLRRTKISFPPLDEQRRIAAILDQADDLRRKRREAMKKVASMPSILFLEMFGDWSRPGFNGRLFQLGDRLDFLTSGSRGWAEYYRDIGSLFLRIQNVRHDELDLSDVAYVVPPRTAEALRTRVQSGDVLLSITADLGRTAVVPDGIGEAFINQHLSILRSSKIEPRYLSAAISSRAGQIDVQAKNREGVKAGLNFNDIRTLKIPDAEITMQRAFATRVAEIDKLKARYRAHLAKLDALFASLQHRAFRGEL
jgi:type I restriction enzyme S subunit